MKKILVLTIVLMALIISSFSAKAEENKISLAISCNLQFVTVLNATDDTGYIYIQKEDGSLEQVFFYPFNYTGGYYTWMRDDLYLWGNDIKINSGYFGGEILEPTVFHLNCGQPEFSSNKFIFLPLTIK